MEGNTYDCLLRETLWLGKRYFMYMTMVVMGKACGGAARQENGWINYTQKIIIKREFSDLQSGFGYLEISGFGFVFAFFRTLICFKLI